MSNSLQRWFDNRSLSPFRDFSKIEDRFERLFNEMANIKKSNGELAEFSPSCEIAEEGNKFLLKFDLPGVSKDQVKVEVNGDQLTVSAERKEEKKSESKKKYLSEVFYGSYSRTFTLPAPLDEKNIDAKFENGVLTISVPKTEVLKVKQIPVQ